MTDYICDLCDRTYKIDLKEEGLTYAHFIHDRSCKDGIIIKAHVLRYIKWAGKEPEIKIIELPEGSKVIEVLTDEEKKSMNDIEKLNDINGKLDKNNKRLCVVLGLLSAYELKDNEKEELISIMKECNDLLLGGILIKETLEKKIKTARLK